MKKENGLGKMEVGARKGRSDRQRGGGGGSTKRSRRVIRQTKKATGGAVGNTEPRSGKVNLGKIRRSSFHLEQGNGGRRAGEGKWGSKHQPRTSGR